MYYCITDTVRAHLSLPKQGGTIIAGSGEVGDLSGGWVHSQNHWTNVTTWILLFNECFRFKIYPGKISKKSWRIVRISNYL